MRSADRVRRPQPGEAHCRVSAQRAGQVHPTALVRPAEAGGLGEGFRRHPHQNEGVHRADVEAGRTSHSLKIPKLLLMSRILSLLTHDLFLSHTVTLCLDEGLNRVRVRRPT